MHERIFKLMDAKEDSGLRLRKIRRSYAELHWLRSHRQHRVRP